MNKNLIRLTESGLHRIIKESVKSILNEGLDDDDISWDDMMNINPQQAARPKKNSRFKCNY